MGVTVRVPAGGRAVVVRPEGEALVELARHPAGVFEGEVLGAELPLRYELEVSYPGRLELHPARPVRLPADARRPRPAPRRRGSPRGALPAAWCARPRARGSHRDRLRGLGAQRPRRERRGRLQLLDGRLHVMRSLGSSGIWELFVPTVEPGAHYKFEIRGADGELHLKADLPACHGRGAALDRLDRPPPKYARADGAWLTERRASDPQLQPISVYEVPRLAAAQPAGGRQVLTYLELADELAAYVTDLGFTHIELLPVMAHPFKGSVGLPGHLLLRPNAAVRRPRRLRRVRRPHARPRHRRAAGLGAGALPARRLGAGAFDGTALFEHADPRRGAHRLGHADLQLRPPRGAQLPALERAVLGPRVPRRRHPHDVASMLYLDYSREGGEWIPNEFGGREDLDAVTFLKELNEASHAREPGVISAAEESTAYLRLQAGPTWAAWAGLQVEHGLDARHAGLLPAGPGPPALPPPRADLRLMYAFSENFILLLSHDDVVHGKGSLLQKMPATAGSSWPTCACCTATCGRTRKKPCSWAASWPRTASGATSARWTGTCRRGPRGRAASRARPQPRLPRHPRAVDNDRLSPHAERNVVAFA